MWGKKNHLYWFFPLLMPADRERHYSMLYLFNILHISYFLTLRNPPFLQFLPNIPFPSNGSRYLMVHSSSLGCRTTPSLLQLSPYYTQVSNSPSLNSKANSNSPKFDKTVIGVNCSLNSTIIFSSVLTLSKALKVSLYLPIWAIQLRSKFSIISFANRTNRRGS